MNIAGNKRFVHLTRRLNDAANACKPAYRTASPESEENDNRPYVHQHEILGFR